MKESEMYFEDLPCVKRFLQTTQVKDEGKKIDIKLHKKMMLEAASKLIGYNPKELIIVDHRINLPFFFYVTELWLVEVLVEDVQCDNYTDFKMTWHFLRDIKEVQINRHDTDNSDPNAVTVFTMNLLFDMPIDLKEASIVHKTICIQFSGIDTMDIHQRIHTLNDIITRAKHFMFDDEEENTR